MHNMKECLSYDDCLLVPQYSDIEHRSDISLASELDSGIVLSLPIISSPMDTVTESKMATAMSEAGGLGIIHRYNTIPRQVELFLRSGVNAGCAIGVTGDYLERAQELYKAGCRIFCIDVAHGHTNLMRTALYNLTQLEHNRAYQNMNHKEPKKVFYEAYIIAGNVATAKAFNDLSSWGANAIRVGIGAGSICETQIRTGFGVPSLSSIMQCYEATNDNDAKIIADGGIKTSGDIVKAYAAGADFVMLGSLLAGTYETPGDIIETEYDGEYKTYRGMASKEAQISFKGSTSSLEGVSSTIRYKGSVKDVLKELETGIRSGLSYNGSNELAHLRLYHEFIKRTNASILESQPHILTRK